MNEGSGTGRADDWLDRAIRDLVERAGSDAPDEPATLWFAPPARRPHSHWLAAAAALLVLVALASVVALRGGSNQTAESLPALQSSPSATTARRPTSTSTIPTATPTTAKVVPSTTTPTARPVVQKYGTIKCGDGIGKITIPAIDVNFYYVACVGTAELNRGVGHFPKSVTPGQLGNAALTGHRTSHLAPFSDLDELKAGDVIQIETILGGAYTYVVTGSEVVEPSDYHVVTDSDPTRATLTLITCTPKFTSKQRLVVHAELDPTRTPTPVGVGQVYYGAADPDTSLSGNADRLPESD